MHKIAMYAAFGWLAFGGVMHFMIDVVSQYVRGKRAPSPETTLYFGLNTGYALGQVVFGLLTLLVLRRSADVLREWPFIALSLGAGLAWLTFSFLFIEYREPKVVVSIFCVLLAAATTTR